MDTGPGEVEDDPPPAPAQASTTPGRARRFAAPVPERRHRWGLGAYALAEAVFIGVAVLVSLVGPQPVGAGLLALVILAPSLAAATVAVVATWVRGGGPVADLGLSWSWADVRTGLGFGVAGMLFTLPALMLYVAIVGPAANSAAGDVFGEIRAGPLAAFLVFVVLVLLAPLCEEIVYRGLLWGALERLGAGRWVAFAITTLLFALAHFELTRTPLLLVVAVPIGLARLQTGRIVASIVAHQINNLLPGIVLLLGLLGVPLPVT